MKTFLALAAAVILSAACATSPSRLRGETLGIGGVFIGDSPSRVQKVLGSPQGRSDELGFVSLRLGYPGLTVGFDGEDVVHVSSTSAQLCTTEGLCPGDPVKKMRQLYGRPELAERETGTFLEYYAVDSSCWYQLRESKGRVAEVALVCQP